MTPPEVMKQGREMNTEDFNFMRMLLSEIELKTLQVDPLRLREFYLPIRNMIMEAHCDANNPNDSFLYPKSNP